MNYQVIVGWGCRGIVILLTFLNTRLLLDVMGGQGFAIQSILVSMTGWFALLNLGLPMTAQNKIAALKGRGRTYNHYVNRVINIMISQFLIFLPAAILLTFFVEKVLLCGYLISSSASILFYCFSLFTLGQGQLFYQILYAKNLAVYPNGYPAVVALLNSITLIFAKGIESNDFGLIISMLACSNLVVVFHAFFMATDVSTFRLNLKIKNLIFNFLKNYPNWIFAFFSTVTLAFDYIIMSQVLSVDDIVAYNLVSRVFGVILILHGVMLSTNWSSLSELTQSGKHLSARKKMHNLLMAGLILSGILGLLFVVWGNYLINIWVGRQSVHVDFSLLISCYVYILVRVWTDSYAVGLLGYGKVSVLNFYIPFQAVISVSLQFLFGYYWGGVGIYCGLIFSFLLTASWILPYYFYLKVGRIECE